MTYWYAKIGLVSLDIPPPPPQPFNTEFPPEPSSSELATTKSFGGESPVNEPCSDGESDNSDYVEGGEELGEDDMVFRGCDDEIDSDEIDSDEIDSDEIDSDEEHRDEIDSDEEHRDSERE
ncbi:hypothetical protein BKA70DRAFT_1230887 [Coprinopsis sp. MPI-PUGE-AT-0042]|nr:hypothetical protein BKA70DRAFT_1230887 [Coprinopsis sp. MPI-PUGE-AT-0042]